MATSKRCCVFVGNIPYDATEEQLKQICEEVGPVISFRLVVDKETGKPKGYGFCEYKDDETALSARRNLQGYDINGRHLRVDFAENDKNSDRSRDQVRGGSISEIPKQDEVREDSGTFSVGPPLASASMMEGSLGVSHIGSSSSPDLLMPEICSDPLTIYLSKMSKNELNEVISDVKGMTSENMKLAGNILSRNPQLTEALFQAQIMLGMVTPQQFPSAKNSLDLHSSSISYEEQRTCKSSVQLLPSVSVLHGGNVQSGAMPTERKMAEFSQSQFPKTHDPTQLQFTNNIFPETSMSVIRVPSTLSSNARYQSAFPVISKAMSTALPHQMQPFLPPLPHSPVFSGQPWQPTESSSFMHMPTEETKLTKPYSSQPSWNTPMEICRDGYESIKINSVPTHLNWREESHLIRKATEIPDSFFHPSKLQKIESRKHTSFSPGFTHTSANVPPPNINQVTSFDMSNKFMQEIQIPPELEWVLLKQVVKLTPDQLSSLPPDQQQQVTLLQHMLQ